jgi:hypothetical protein
MERNLRDVRTFNNQYIYYFSQVVSNHAFLVYSTEY